ncbi:zf-HC2 domain-containing protein [Streptomyces luteolifulvus]|uniref:Zf-HC2 domain-containing protein n=1 Tax=Streptomyces luteolifulvus TaxID=2615112 RepID=A0A6H9V317_9ACTN|nr:zf-HC2 domain-containing protein [Streptomyces luteolifulvus]KAB1147638.1 zf-HC2 domain-containing protein [Streptomyces luteolifulvus]
MSGTRPNPAERLLAETHLGDRLSALVDGELGHDSRDRVLAHLATCPKCKAEADAQRRLKNVFAEAAPPPPSESFLARLQGLPAGGDPAGGDTPLGGEGFDGLSGRPGADGALGVFGLKRGDRFEFGYVPVRSHGSVLPAAASADPGFRIHDVSRHEAERSASRGLRFAFVAAGAVSLAAIALGGVTTGATVDPAADSRGGTGAGSNMTPARPQGTGAATAPENQRRRGAGPLLAQGQGQRSSRDTPVAPTEVSAPVLPGISATGGARADKAVHTLTTPVVAGAAAMSPLIRPLATSPLSLTSWSAPDLPAPGLFAPPVQDATSSPSSPPSSASSR